jgi:hypothetical protein
MTLPDNYLQYALTWYGLAGVLVISGLLAGRSEAAVSPPRTKTPGKSVAYTIADKHEMVWHREPGTAVIPETMPSFRQALLSLR